METVVCTGIGVSDGVRMAKARVYHQPAVRQAVAETIAPEQADTEQARLRVAAEKAGQVVEQLLQKSQSVLQEEQIGILKGQKSMLTDPAFVPEMQRRIQKQNLSAEAAVRAVTEQFAELFRKMPDPYMQERAADVQDAGSRLLRILSGEDCTALSEIQEESILLAQDLSASDTVQLDRRYVLAFAMEQGGATSHTSIFARSMGIPAVVGISGLLQQAHDGDWVIVDGAAGKCILRPDEKMIAEYRKKMQEEAQRRELLTTYAGKPAALANGRRMIAAANIGSDTDAAFALQQGAEASGLLRTEQLFLSRGTAPTEEEQFTIYRRAAEAFSKVSPGSVVIRTLDIGGDKAVPYLSIPKEQNPFLGYRAIRLCLEQKELFLTQLRAILRASAFGKVQVMFPMISGIGELLAAKAMLQEAKAQLHDRGEAYDQQISVGVMIEIPSAALTAPALAKEVDFFSIGTNDLVQYTLAVDRGNEKVASLYDYFHPAVLQLIHLTLQAAQTRRIPVGMCGNMAGDPLAVPLLAGMGLQELSMAAGSIPQVKYVLSCVTAQECHALAEAALRCDSPQEVRKKLRDFAHTHRIQLPQ